MPREARRDVVVERGPNLVPPPAARPLPEDVCARVGIIVGDDISTGDMSPDGAIGMAVWSNISACARYMFQRLDPEFPGRLAGWGGGLIVGGHNYGQGSSREHAALSALHLGVPAVLAASYARIHRRNLIGVGIVPLELADPEFRTRLEVGHTVELPGLRAAISRGDTTFLGQSDAGELHLSLALSDEERAVLLAGGLLAHLREAARRPLQ